MAQYVKLIDAKTAPFTSTAVNLDQLGTEQILRDVYVDYVQGGPGIVVVEASLGAGSAFQDIKLLSHSASVRITGYPAMRLRLTDVGSGTHSAGIYGDIGSVSSESALTVITDLGFTAGLQLCLDAGDAASYTSGQTWNDLSSNGDNFYRGASGSPSSADPVFNGTAGQLTGSEYWSFDGSQYFQYTTSNTAWMNSLHQANAKFTLACWLYAVSSGGPTQGIIGDDANLVVPGTEWALGATVSGRPQLYVANSGGPALNVSGDSYLNYNAWNFVAISLDSTIGAGGGFHYLNGAYNQVSGSDTFNSTYSSPSAAASSYPLGIGTSGNGAVPLTNGSRMAIVMAWAGVSLTKTELDDIWTATRSRFGV